jgi:hypothetical protein
MPMAAENSHMKTPETFLSFETVKRLVSRLNSIRKKRATEINKMADIFGDPLELAKVYVQPDCQQFNPANLDEDRPASISFVTSPIFTTLEKFLKGGRKDENDGRYIYFILSDAGMGKTSVLSMLKLSHLMAFWPKSWNCELFKLDSDTVDKVNKLERKNKTVLLLDALDEDPLGWGRVEERLDEVIRCSVPFYRTIISCRTQFFPQTAPDPFGSSEMVKVGHYRCPLIYLSLFDPEKIEEYLQRRFPATFLVFGRDVARREAARILVKKMDTLSCRPLLLSHIEDLVDASIRMKVGRSKFPAVTPELKQWTEFGVYEALVATWLSREAWKLAALPRAPFSANEDLRNEQIKGAATSLQKACAHLAVTMQLQHRRSASNTEINDLCGQVPEISHIRHVDIKGRSLLNKNSKGEFRFSHYSIQEFLVVNSALLRASLRGIAMFNLRFTEDVPSVTDELSRCVSAVAKAKNAGEIESTVAALNELIPWTAQMTRFAQSAPKIEPLEPDVESKEGPDYSRAAGMDPKYVA